MNLRYVLVPLVPRGWSGALALVVARFLREFEQAIWDVHGEIMLEEMRDRPGYRDDHEWSNAHDRYDRLEDDIPF